MHGAPRASLIAPMFAVALSFPSVDGLHAQAVRGRLIDDRSETAVAGATITLFFQLDLIHQAVSLDDGFFLVPVPHEGTFQLEAERIGYGIARSQPFLVERGDTLTVEFRLLPDAILLAPILVTARSNAGRSRFYRRMDGWGRGLFLTPEMVDSIQPRHAVDVLRKQEDVYLTWGWGRLSSGASGPVPDVHTFVGRGCLNYMVNNVAVKRSTWEVADDVSDWTTFALEGLSGNDVVAVEIYRTIQEVPLELRAWTDRGDGFWALDAEQCGIVNFWTAEAW